MNNGQANETAETPAPVKGPEPKKIKNAIYSKVIGECSEIVQELLENGGNMTKLLKKFTDQKTIILPEMADPYGFLLSRLEFEILYWEMRAPLGMEPVLEKMHQSLINRITKAMSDIKLWTFKGLIYEFHLSEYGILEWGHIKEESREEESGKAN